MNCTELPFHSNSKQKAADKFSEVSFHPPIISTRCGSFSSLVSSYCNKLSENWSPLSFLQPSKHNPKIGIPAFPHPSGVSWDFGISKAIKYDYIFSAIRPPVRRIGQLRAFIIHFKWLPKFSLGWCRFIAESLYVSVFLGIYIARGWGHQGSSLCPLQRQEMAPAWARVWPPLKLWGVILSVLSGPELRDQWEKKRTEWKRQMFYADHFKPQLSGRFHRDIRFY